MNAIKRVSKALVDIRVFSESQMQAIEAIIAYFDAKLASDETLSEETRKRYAKRMYRRVEILTATRATSDKTCNRYFISKNVFLHDAEKHLFCLARAKRASAKSAKSAKLEATNAVALLEATNAVEVIA
jgi:hypothetical protein